MLSVSRIIIHIRGGVLQGVVTDSPGVEIMVVDHDDLAAGDNMPNEYVPLDVEPSAFATAKGNAPE
jgi:hypothetical protein